MPLVTQDHYLKIFGFPVIDYYRRLGFDFSSESFEVIGTEFIEGYEARKYEARLFEEVPQILKILADHGVSHSVLSAYQQETLDELIDHFSLGDNFLKVVGLDNHYAHSKLENGLKWMAELPYSPDEVLFVGDTAHDLEVAQALGVDCTLLDSGHQTRARLEATGGMVVDGLEALLLNIDSSEKRLSHRGNRSAKS